MVNFNKVFPRLSIRVKLVLGFVAVALVPGAIVTVIGAWQTVRGINSTARITVERDLQLVESRTSQRLASAESHVEFVASSIVRPSQALTSIPHDSLRRLGEEIALQIATEPTLYRVKLLDPEGLPVMSVRATGVDSLPRDPEASAELIYSLRAAELAPGARALLPIEVRTAAVDSSGRVTPLAALAIVMPLRDSAGTLLGVVVGEAYASRVFAGIDEATPGFEGITALVSEDGQYLFHTAHKRSWSTLLAAGAQARLLAADIPPPLRSALLGRTPGTEAANGRLISFRPFEILQRAPTRLHLYRQVDLFALSAPVRRFVALVALACGVLTTLVVGVAMLAAVQFTRPILAIRDAAWRLARGESLEPLSVETNDEIEDLGRDFTEVARLISEHRAERERLYREQVVARATSDADLNDLLENSADAIIALDPSGYVRRWNQGATQLFGWTAAEASGKAFEGLVPAADERTAREDEAMREELSRRSVVAAYVSRRAARDGTPIPVSLTTTRVTTADGRDVGTLVIARDHRLAERLEAQMRRSERLSAISIMAAGLAHEINNPLAILGNRIECMQRDVRSRFGEDELDKDLNVLQRHVTRLRELTSSLLRFAREDGQQFTTVHLEALLNDATQLLQRTLRSRRVTLTHDVTPGMPPVAGDAKAIETVLVNLILNAADAMPDGGVVTVGIHGEQHGRTACLEVSDTGPGVPEPLRERIFEPFFTTKEAGKGTGLGLTVCRSIIDGHGGSLRVERAAAGGARFVIDLPFASSVTRWPASASS